MVARFGGDEYVVVAPMQPAEELGQRLADTVSRRHLKLESEGRVCSALLSVSVGVAQSDPLDTAYSLIARADEALLSVKRRGKGGVRVAA